LKPSQIVTTLGSLATAPGSSGEPAFGHHPLTAWCDNTGELLAVLLRPGNAGSNTAADHLTVLKAAIAQIPPEHRRKILVTVDGAGSTHALVDHVTALNAEHPVVQ
jgi:DDE family transposase